MTRTHEKTAGGKPAAGGGVADATNLHPNDTTENAQSQEELLATAFVYSELGYSVIPLRTRSKIPAIKWEPYQSRQPSEVELTTWFGQFTDANLAIVTGAVSGVIVLDVDGPEGEAEVKHRGLPPTPMARTGKGQHFYFRHPGGVVKNFARKLPGLDLRGDGGYVVAPPSIHENGTSYTWEVSPLDADLADPPAWLIEMIRNEPKPTPAVSTNGRDPYAKAAFDNELAILAQTPEGSRNDQLNTSAFNLGQFVGAGRLDENEVIQALVNTARSIGLDESEINPTIQSGLESGRAQPRRPEKSSNNGTEPTPGARCTDYGNAERLVKQHSDKLRYCHDWRKWLAWTGRRWAVDDTGAVIRLAKKTVRSIYAEAAGIEDDAIREKVGKWAHRSESKARIESMLGLAQSEPGIPITSDHLDRDPWLLNVTNGTLDLRTGDLRPHAGGDLITKFVPVAYDPAAQAPTWGSFLARIMAGNENLIRFLQHAIGYSLTGDTSEQVIFILYGTGANGKSTLLNTLGDLLNDYARQTGTDTLLVKKFDSISNDVARLKGARLVTAVEAGDGRRMAENLVKQMTGGDRLTARFLYTESFEFMPTFKIWLATNHKPTIRGTDHAIWRRIRLVPFNVTIPEPEQDKALPHKLRAELPGILAWAVRGCLDWQRDGLGLPEEIKEATEGYQAEMDTIGAFLADCCVIEETTQTRAKELYDAYKEWCDDNGEYKATGTAFGRQLAERGFDKYRDGKGNVYVGLGLLTDDVV